MAIVQLLFRGACCSLRKGTGKPEGGCGVMFSNLGEYQGFLEKNCERCKRYISWEDDPSGVCPIEDAFFNYSTTGEGFPKDKVALNEHGCWECKGFEGEGAE